ncbi:MAG: transposase [Planctomycetota bacterium]
MTQPRRLLPGAIQFVTRATAGRHFYLQPTPGTKEITSYAFGVSAMRYPAVRVLGTVWLGNHYHAGLVDGIDPLTGLSLLPDFTRDLHSLTARAVNAHLDRGENLWRTGSYGNVEVRTEHDLTEQLLYVWCQAVEAGLVARPEDWPGFQLLPAHLGATLTFERPQQAFFGARRPEGRLPTEPRARARALKAQRQEDQAERRRRRSQDRRRGRGKRRSNQLERERLRVQNTDPERAARSELPDRVTFTVGVPPGWEDRPLEETRAHFQGLLDERVAEIARLREESGLPPPLGPKRALEVTPFARAGDTRPNFSLDPRIAAKDRQLRKALLAELREWRRVYRDARQAWAQGKRDVLFPAGSYELPRRHAAPFARVPRARLLL